MATGAPFGPKVLDLGDPVDRGHPLNRGRAAWWLVVPSWSGGGTWFDLLGQYDGTLVGGAAWGPDVRPGSLGGHVSTDGVDDRVETPAALGAGPVTVACWVRLPATPPGYRYALGSKDNFRGLRFPGSATALLCDGATDIGTLSVGSDWAQLIGVLDGTNGTLYVNGIQSGTAASAVTGWPQLIMGDRSVGITDPLNCLLDDVGLWSRALSADEAGALYDLSRRGYPRGLSWYVPRLWSLPPPPAGGAASGAGSAAGTGAAAGVGAAKAAGTGTAAGTATVAATGAALAAGAGTSAGLGTAAGTGAATVAAPGSAAGTASALAVGASRAAGVGSAAGTSAVTGTAPGVAAGAGSAAGQATAAGTGAALARGAGSTAGLATVTGAGSAALPAAGLCAGQATVLGAGLALASGAGTAAGTGFAAGILAALASGAGLAAGTALVFGHAPSGAPSRLVPLAGRRGNEVGLTGRRQNVNLRGSTS